MLYKGVHLLQGTIVILFRRGGNLQILYAQDLVQKNYRNWLSFECSVIFTSTYMDYFEIQCRNMPAT